MDGEKKRARALPGTVLVLGLTSFFTDVGGEMVFPLLPVFLASLGAGPSFLGLLEGVADATAAFLKYLSGAWADRLQRKKPLVLFGYGIASLARPLVSLAAAPWHVLAVRITDRVGKGVRTAPRDVLIAASVTSSDAGRAFGFHRAMDHAGAVVGPLLATLLLWLGLSTRHVFAVTLIPGLAAVICVALIRERPKGEDPAPEAALPKRPASTAPLPPRLKTFLGILLLFALGNSSDAFLLVRAKELGTADALLPMLWAALHVSKMSFTWLGGLWSDRTARPPLVIAGWGVYALVYLALAGASQAWQVWLLFLVYGLFYGLTEPVEKALIKDLAPAEMHGRAFGLYHAMLGASAIPAGLLTGGLWQKLGAPVALLTGAGIAFAAAVALFFWSRSSEPARPS